jgi:hypothetical protein
MADSTASSRLFAKCPVRNRMLSAISRITLVELAALLPRSWLGVIPAKAGIQ